MLLQRGPTICGPQYCPPPPGLKEAWCQLAAGRTLCWRPLESELKEVLVNLHGFTRTRPGATDTSIKKNYIDGLDY